MEDDDLPPNLLIEQDERQILPHQKITEAVNLGTEEERKELKIGTTLSPATRKKLINLLQDYNECSHGHTWTCQASTQISWYTVCR